MAAAAQGRQLRMKCHTSMKGGYMLQHALHILSRLRWCLRLLGRLAAALPALIALCIAVLVIAPLAKLTLPVEDAALCA